MNSLCAILSLIYQAGCQAKNLFYRLHVFRPKKAPFPVISIGNIAFGGSEKTPLVMAVIATLLHRGHKPVLVTRGYKGRWEQNGGILSDGKNILGQWTDSGDEAYMIALNFPRVGVFVGKDRLASCRKAFQRGFELAVLDDGFQHRKLYRDLDIVLHDPQKRIPLREPPSSLNRAHALLLKADTSAEAKTGEFKNTPGLETYVYSVEFRGFFSLDGRSQVDTEGLKTQRIIAFCGIARPERFRKLLKALGLEPCGFLSFSDHHAYPKTTQEKLLKAFLAQKADAFVTTEKDAVKIRDFELFQGRPAYFLKIGLKIEDAFDDLILSRIAMAKRNRSKDATSS